MNDAFLHVYHGLPAPLRSLAASLRGFQLRSWRYGRDTDRLVEEALDRDNWSPEQWRSWREERLAYVLHRAATRVPYYRAHWAVRRRHGDRASWEVLHNWPILEKQAVRASPRAFLVDDCQPSRMYREQTSGTTGTPLVLWWSRTTVRQWYALMEARWRRWYGVSRHHRWAILGGQPVVPPKRRRPPYWVWNEGLNQLYISSYHLSPDRIAATLEAMRRYRVRYAFGYTSSLQTMAREAMTRGATTQELVVAIANAEPVLHHQRQTISTGLRCPVRETYGMAEIVTAAGECEAGSLHLWPEVGVVEVLVDGVPAAPGDSGELICTGLFNADMPLIRYRVGDRGALAADSMCMCGRTLPILASVEGRSDDVLHAPDGRAVGRLDPVFKADLAIREAQIVQEALDRIRIRYVPAPGFTSTHGRSMADRLRQHMGEVQVVLEEVESIPRTANGKFRAVVCNIDRDRWGGSS
jgi:phenylacetate-CoA ligase